jgi:hypothetical protein
MSRPLALLYGRNNAAGPDVGSMNRHLEPEPGPTTTCPGESGAARR